MRLLKHSLGHCGSAEGSSPDAVDLPSRSGHQQPSVRVIVEKKFLRKGQLETAVAAAAPETTRSKAHVSGEVVPSRTIEKQSESSHRRRNYYGQLTRTIEALEQHLNQEDSTSQPLRKKIASENEPHPLKSRVEEDKRKQNTFVSTLTIDLPKHLKPAIERKPMTGKEPWKPFEDRIIEPHTTTQSTGGDVPRELESTTDYKIPINDMRIRRVLHRNKKLMKALIEAYKLRFTTSTIPSTTTSRATTATTAGSIEVSKGISPLNFVGDIKLNKVVTSGAIASTEIVPVPSTEGASADSSSTTMETEAFDQDATTEYLHTTTKNNSEPPTSESPVYSVSNQTEDSEDFTESTAAQQTSSSPTESFNDLELQADTIEVPGENTTSSENLQEVERASATEGLNQSEITSSQPNKELTSTIETSAFTNTANGTASTASTTTQLPYWPKKGYVPTTKKHASEITSKLYMTREIVQGYVPNTKKHASEITSKLYMTREIVQGYVPNTKKHASEITSKLYMTREIVQVLSEDPIRRPAILKLDSSKRACRRRLMTTYDRSLMADSDLDSHATCSIRCQYELPGLENKRCCKVTRTECPDGSQPKLVKRYYRPRGSDTCLPYHYPRCSPNEEMEEQPIQYEQNCQDLCFAGPEKRIAPLLQLAIEK
ncbi:hypothetical protein OSTOST_03533 [Ostertagia ostertagi]